MYTRQLAYTIIPGNEERAVALCGRFVATLHDHGVPARVLVARTGAFTLQIAEEYRTIEDLDAKRSVLDRDEEYQSVLSAWAKEFYPLVQAAAPAIIFHDKQAA